MTFSNMISKNPTLFSMCLCCVLHLIDKTPKIPPFFHLIPHTDEYKPKSINLINKPKSV